MPRQSGLNDVSSFGSLPDISAMFGCYVLKQGVIKKNKALAKFLHARFKAVILSSNISLKNIKHVSKVLELFNPKIKPRLLN